MRHPRHKVTLWDINPQHSSLRFLVRQGKVGYLSGELKFCGGSVRVDENDPANTSVVAAINATSIDTGQRGRDAQLRSAAFLDTIHYPEITFVSKTVEVRAHAGYKIAGDLTIHGRTRPVTVIAEAISPTTEDSLGRIRCGTSAIAWSNRRDFGMNCNSPLEGTAGFLGDDVSITIGVELVERQPERVFVADDAVVEARA